MGKESRETFLKNVLKKKNMLGKKALTDFFQLLVKKSKKYLVGKYGKNV